MPVLRTRDVHLDEVSELQEELPLQQRHVLFHLDRRERQQGHPERVCPSGVQRPRCNRAGGVGD